MTSDSEYAVIFVSKLKPDQRGYEELADAMVARAAKAPGFLRIESVRDGAGTGITVSYWADLESIRKWKLHADHTIARNKGRSDWYQSFKTRIAKVEKDYGFEK